jgi:hypothetical protein
MVGELQSALDAARRRCALLEMQLSNQHHVAAGKQRRVDLVRDAAELSSLHFRKYRQIRQDYHRLLNKCDWLGGCPDGGGQLLSFDAPGH